MSEKCKHCQNGWFDDQRFGCDVECVNGVLIDIDEYTEGWQHDVDYPVAPCHPHWADQCNEVDFDNDSQLRLRSHGEGWDDDQEPQP